MEAQLASFWSRIVALFVDSILLGAIGAISGIFLFDFYVQLGPSGRLIGFAVAMLYFGLLQSSMGRGQTLGKKWLKIRVINADGSYLSLGKSFGRYTILGVPYFLNGAHLPVGASAILIMLIAGFLIFGLGFGILYFYFANRRTRQSLHDLVFGTCVVKSQSEGPLTKQIWKGHFVIAFVLLSLLLSGGYFAQMKLAEHFDFQGMLELQSELNELDFVFYNGVQDRRSSFNGEESRSLVVNALVAKRPELADAESLEIARIVAEDYPDVFKTDGLVLVRSYGYDIGIASASFSTTDQFQLSELKTMLLPNYGSFVDVGKIS